MTNIFEQYFQKDFDWLSTADKNKLVEAVLKMENDLKEAKAGMKIAIIGFETLQKQIADANKILDAYFEVLMNDEVKPSKLYYDMRDALSASEGPK